jgi:sulfide dehydrogenase cytochrome subunit
MATRFAMLAAAAFAAPALAQQPAPPPAFAAANLSPAGVAAMAANCAICHGPMGKPAPGSTVLRLAGRPADSIVEAMKAFRDGKRQATVMHQIAKGFGDAEIAALAAYFAAQREGS